MTVKVIYIFLLNTDHRISLWARSAFQEKQRQNGLNKLMTLTNLETGSRKQETLMSGAKICIGLKGLILHSQFQRRKNPPAFSSDHLASVQKVLFEPWGNRSTISADQKFPKRLVVIVWGFSSPHSTKWWDYIRHHGTTCRAIYLLLWWINTTVSDFPAILTKPEFRRLTPNRTPLLGLYQRSVKSLHFLFSFKGQSSFKT